MYIYWLKKSLISKNSLLVFDSWWRVQCDVSILRTTTHQKSISHTQFWSSQNTCSLLITIKTVHLSRIKNIFRVKQHFRSAATTFTHNPPKNVSKTEPHSMQLVSKCCMLFFFLCFFSNICWDTRGDSLRLSRWERARHMARGISRRTPPSDRSCRFHGPRRWLCLGCWTVRTGSPPPAPPAPRTAPAHLIREEEIKG